MEQAVAVVVAMVSTYIGPLNACDPVSGKLTAAFLYRAGAQTTPDFRENFRISPTTIFSAVGTQTAVLVSTTKARISVPDAQPLVLVVLWVDTIDFGFSARGQAFPRVSASEPRKTQSSEKVAKKWLGGQSESNEKSN